MKSGSGKPWRTKVITDIRHEIGFAYIAEPSYWKPNSFTSDARVLENGIPLPGPANALHDDIRRLGGGRYSFWYGAVYFSTTDNSDPLTNDRRYAIQYRPPLTGEILALFPSRVQNLFIYQYNLTSGIVHRLSRAIISPRARQFAGRISGRVRQIKLAEIPWDLFYWLCFIVVFFHGKIAGGLLSRRKIEDSTKPGP